MTCAGCGGTFYPTSIAEIGTHQAIRYGLLREPERWHLTEALAADLHSRLDSPGAAGTVDLNPGLAMSIFGIPRCEHDLFA